MLLGAGWAVWERLRSPFLSLITFKRTKNKQGVLITKGEPLFCSKRQALKKVNSLLSEFTHYSFQTRQSGDNLQSVLKFSFAGSGSVSEAGPRPPCAGLEATSFSKMSRHDREDLEGLPIPNKKQRIKLYPYKSHRDLPHARISHICIRPKDGYLHLIYKIKLDQ